MTQTYEFLTLETEGDILCVRLTRPDKRNALNDGMISEVRDAFTSLTDNVRVVVLYGQGDHFSAGLDLSEHKSRNAQEVMLHSQTWHRAFDAMQTCGVPVIMALHGGVIGGGLELAVSSHIRVADETTFYALPEGQRGIFVGGGASVRVARTIGTGRMMEMMLTGRTYDADEGLQFGLSHYVVPKGEALGKAMELAKQVAANAPLTNYAILNALPRIENMSAQEGLFTESLIAAIVQTGDEARAGMADFLEKRAKRPLN